MHIIRDARVWIAARNSRLASFRMVSPGHSVSPIPSPISSCYHPMNCARYSLGRGRALYDAINQHVSQLISTVTKSRSGNEPPPTSYRNIPKIPAFSLFVSSLPPSPSPSFPPPARYVFAKIFEKYLWITENCELIVSFEITFNDHVRITLEWRVSYIFFWKEMEAKYYIFVLFVLFCFFFLSSLNKNAESIF